MSTKSPVEIGWEEDINNTAKESWYTYSSPWVVEGIMLTRILDHLMLRNVIADRWMDLSKYPKIGKSIRKQQPKTLDTNICPTYPAMRRSRTLACISLFSKVPLQFFGEAKGFNSVEPAQSILICFASGFMAHAHLGSKSMVSGSNRVLLCIMTWTQI